MPTDLQFRMSGISHILMINHMDIIISFPVATFIILKRSIPIQRLKNNHNLLLRTNYSIINYCFRIMQFYYNCSIAYPNGQNTNFQGRPRSQMTLKLNDKQMYLKIRKPNYCVTKQTIHPSVKM